LIKKLAVSIDSESIDKYDFSSYFGAWEDNRSTEKIIADLKMDRVNKEIRNWIDNR
jgi:hypothetical protein